MWRDRDTQAATVTAEPRHGDLRPRRSIGTMVRLWSVAVGLTLAATLVAAVGVQPSAAHAASSCGPWHYIAFGQTRQNLKIEANNYITATGNPNQDYWNQQIQFCRDPGWGANHYGIHSNRGGGFWTSYFTQFGDDRICSCSSQIFDPHELFEITDYDGNFFLIKSVGRNAYLTAVSGVLRIGAPGAPPNGANLYLISPRDLRYW